MALMKTWNGYEVADANARAAAQTAQTAADAAQTLANEAKEAAANAGGGLSLLATMTITAPAEGLADTIDIPDEVANAVSNLGINGSVNGDLKFVEVNVEFWAFPHRMIFPVSEVMDEGYSMVLKYPFVTLYRSASDWPVKIKLIISEDALVAINSSLNGNESASIKFNFYG